MTLRAIAAARNLAPTRNVHIMGSVRRAEGRHISSGGFGVISVDIVRAHLTHLERLNRRPGTIYQRERTLTRLIEFLEPTHILDATVDDLRAYTDRGLGDEALYGEVSRLAGFYRWALCEGLITVDPSVRLERPTRRPGLPKPMPDAQVRRILVEAPEPERTWYSLAVHGGLRACEIAKVRSSDITASVLVIPEEKGGGASAVPLSCIPLTTILTNVQADGWWFPHGWDADRHVTAGQVSKRANRWLRENGVPHTLHSLRHTFGTTTYRLSNYDLLLTADLMRHKKLDTTRGYTKLEPDRAATVAAAIAGHFEATADVA